MATYSLNIDGYLADQPNVSAKPNYTMPDANAITTGAMQQAMRLNTPLLVLNPDLSQSYYVLDAERSTAANPVLRRV